MKKSFKAATLAVATAGVVTLFGAHGSGAFAQEASAAPADTAAMMAVTPEFTSEPIVQPVDPVQEAEDKAANEAPARANSLNELVSATPIDGDLSRDMRCLAGAIYFESKGEPLEGQLAVGRVIVNRAASDRWPDSYCGVVYQKSQFSFVRGGKMPGINTGSSAWQRAKAIARIAHENQWDSSVEGALFFHASYVSPGWRLARVGQIKNHIFYR